MNQEKYYQVVERDIERIRKYADEARKLQSPNQLPAQLKQRTEDYAGLISETFLG